MLRISTYLSLYACILRLWTNSLLLPVYLAAVSALFFISNLAINVISLTTGARHRYAKVPDTDFPAEEHEETTGSLALSSRGWRTSFLESSRIVSCLVLCGMSVLATIRSTTDINGEHGRAWTLELAQSLYYVSSTLATYRIFSQGEGR